jgi:hypothetical protein
VACKRASVSRSMARRGEELRAASAWKSRAGHRVSRSAVQCSAVGAQWACSRGSGEVRVVTLVEPSTSSSLPRGSSAKTAEGDADSGLRHMQPIDIQFAGPLAHVDQGHVATKSTKPVRCRCENIELLAYCHMPLLLAMPACGRRRAAPAAPSAGPDVRGRNSIAANGVSVSVP